MNRLQRTLILAMALLFLAGCAAAPPVVEQRIVVVERPAPPIEQRAAPPIPRPTEDHDLFTRGLALLSQPDGADPVKARGIFITLLDRYPQSTWRAAAEAFVRLIDESGALQEASWQGRLLLELLQAEWPVVLQENESLKKTVRELRELTEKLQADTASLTQENEKLKRDLQRLKTLEIELEKRERMLR